MARKSAATIAAAAFKPEEAFSEDSLNELLDRYAVPCAREAIRQALPQRVHHHVQRLLLSDEPTDRAELLALMKSAKMTIAFAVFHSVLSIARETAQDQLSAGEDQPKLVS